MNRRDWYERVNAAWPTGPLPKLTAAEAVKAARRLFRFCKMKERIEPTTGNRHTWRRGGVFYVNPEKGWHSLVHSVSHWAHYIRHRTVNVGPHDKSHARLELRLIRQVVKRGWLDGKLRTRPKEVAVADTSPAAVADARLEHARAMLRKAETRAKRAETIRKKWARRVARLEKNSAHTSAA